MNKKRIIIVGGGFAGINTALKLKKADCEVLLIDKSNHHLFQPLLYQVATATLSEKDIAISLREVFAHQQNTQVIMGQVKTIDKETKTITLGNGDQFIYDYLVMATGARHCYFGNHQFEKYAPGLKTLKDALNIREHLLTSFEKAERLDSIAESHKYLTFCIVGAGPTGVEMAGTISEFIKRTLKKNFRNLQIEKAKVILIEGCDRVLPPFAKKLSERTKKDLEKLGVTVLLNQTVSNINEDGLQVGNTFIECKNVIWAAGNEVNPIIKSITQNCDRQGRAIVEQDLSIQGSPEIFVIGDCSHYKTKKGVVLPGIAPVAIQQGNYVGKLLEKEIKKGACPEKRDSSFKYFDKGSLATIGAFKAVGSFRGVKFTGIIAWSIWAFVHIAYLIGYRNRLSVMLEWAMHYLTGKRGARIIHATIDEKLPQKRHGNTAMAIKESAKDKKV